MNIAMSDKDDLFIRNLQKDLAKACLSLGKIVTNFNEKQRN